MFVAGRTAQHVGFGTSVSLQFCSYGDTVRGIVSFQAGTPSTLEANFEILESNWDPGLELLGTMINSFVAI